MIVTITDNIIQLQGVIWEGDGQRVISQVKDVLENNADIEVRIHTPGGSVFDGNLIFNHLVKFQSKIDVIIEGMAASMGSILMLVGRSIKMCENGFVMIHAPNGYVAGTAKDFANASKLLMSMEKNFIKKYMGKTNKPEEEVKTWLDGDNWFDAEEALELGLIDEIVDSTLEIENIEAYKKMNVAALLSGLAPKKPTQAKQIKIDTMKKELISALSLSVVSADSSDTAVIKAVENRIGDIQAESTAKDQKILALETKLKDLAAATIKDAVSAKIKAKLITESQRAKYEDLGEKLGLEALQSIFEDMKPSASITSQINNTTDPVLDKSWDDLKKVPNALEKLQAEDPEKYNALFTAKFGKK
ncbi:MAG: ATP-dependent Clp protease proteolytic subunit [Crocinitomicaceae bacterium]|nr:ATP-dependent Clp protease proteolytic subunit [Crocinitomicaceae bacterium]